MKFNFKEGKWYAANSYPKYTVTAVVLFHVNTITWPIESKKQAFLNLEIWKIICEFDIDAQRTWQ